MEVTASFPAELQSASAARHFAERKLEEWELPELLDATRLLVSELVINAVLHARTESTLTLACRSGVLRVEVSDGSTVPLARRSFSTTATTGRGLMILEALASRWGVEETAGGKTVWFELDVAHADTGTTAAGRARGDGQQAAAPVERADPPEVRGSRGTSKRTGGGGVSSRRLEGAS